MHAIRSTIKPLREFVSGHGFSLLTTLCVCVIAATAMWTEQSSLPSSHTTPPATSIPAAVPMQQSLAEVQITPHPSAEPIRWHAPISDVQLLRGFSDTHMIRSETSGLWSVHAAADLKASQGTPVHAMASGYVSAHGQDDTNGSWISIQHANGYVTKYSSLYMLASYRSGDTVAAGNIIGFVGNTNIDEADLGPHLHLEVFHNGIPIDPIPIWD